MLVHRTLGVFILSGALFTVALGAPRAHAQPDESVEIAREVKLYIAKEHKRRGTDPKVDFEKLHAVCTRSWAARCRFWRNRTGRDRYSFQVRPRGKIYGIPSMLLR